MIVHQFNSLPRLHYPTEPWALVETRFHPELVSRVETLFAQANGYLGVRATPEEGRPFSEFGTFVNGFHETWAIQHPEVAFGFAEVGQTMVNVPDATMMKLYVDDEPLYLPSANLTRYERRLDFASGILSRRLVWETPSGKQVEVTSSRLVSFEHRHLMAMSFEVTVHNAEAPLVISSHLREQRKEVFDEFDPRKAKGFEHEVLQAQETEGHEARVLLGLRTANSAMSLGCGIDHVLETDNPHSSLIRHDEQSGKVVFTVDAMPGVPVRLFKVASYHTSDQASPAELVDRCRRTIDRAQRAGWDRLAEGQRWHLDAFWDRADVQVDDDPGSQQAIRWNLFHIAQATTRVEGAGVPGKSLTGAGYEGHYFWDAEIYLLPFLSYLSPRTARGLLRFRHGMLGAARRRARDVSQEGALFPWRTINGEEASAYYEAGTAQYHINADVAYALRKYVDSTGDEEFLRREGAEILVETARLWADLGFFGGDGRFHIHGVTGPDEYTTLVDDNAFTNLMARHNLAYAAQEIARLRHVDPGAFAVLVEATRLRPGEIEAWEQAAAHMYVPHDEALGITPQDDDFLGKERWDFENTPIDNYPLLLSYHPLVIYRFQVIKQADVVLAMFLLDDEFGLEEKRRNFEYYDPLTTGDSSLGPPIQSILAAEIGESDKAWTYFQVALHMDLADINRNSADGIHVASCGGVWMALVYGFGGMRDCDGRLCFEPRLPDEWRALRFGVEYQGTFLRIEVTGEHTTYSVAARETSPVEIEHRGEMLTVAPGDSVSRSNEASAPRQDEAAPPLLGSRAPSG